MKTKMNKTTVFINAQQMAIDHPETFHWPVAEANFEIGDIVKVAIPGERFWVLITRIKGEVFTGRVSNALISGGLGFGDSIKFGRENIYEIYAEEIPQK